MRGAKKKRNENGRGRPAEGKQTHFKEREGKGMSKKVVITDTENKTSPSCDVSTPAWPECDRNVLEPMLSMAFVAIAPTSNIYRVSKAFSKVLEEYPEVKVLYSRTSLGRLWIVEGKPDE
jgi:hypothetical protein